MTHPLAPLMAEIKERLGLDLERCGKITVQPWSGEGEAEGRLVVTVETPARWGKSLLVEVGSTKALALAFPSFDVPLVPPAEVGQE